MSKEPKEVKPSNAQPPGMREMLAEIHKSNIDNPETKQVKGPPGAAEVGIFWEVNGLLIIDGVPLDQAESWGRFKNYPGSHEKMCGQESTY